MMDIKIEFPKGTGVALSAKGHSIHRGNRTKP